MRRIYMVNGLNIRKNLAIEGFDDKFIDKHWLKFHYYLTRVLYKYLYRTKSKNGFVKLYVEKIKKVIKPIKASTVPQRFRSESDIIHLHLLIRELLEKWQVIISHTEQNGQKRIFRCKIKDEWYSNGYTLYKEVIPSKLLSSINEVHKSRNNDFKGIYKRLNESFIKIQLDEEKAIEWLDKAYQEGIRLKDKRDKYGNWRPRFMNVMTYSFYKMAIENFNDSKYFHVADSGRIYSSVTNLPSLLRRFLHFDGVYIKEYDIPNAQPLLLSYLFDTDKLYQELVEKGEFYKYLKKILENRNIAVSDNFKVDFFTKMMFGTHKRKSTEEKIFEGLFPITHFSIRSLKHINSYKSLSKLLQKKEADCMRDVCNQLISKGISNIVTLHDAILYLPENEKEVISEMKKCFYVESSITIQ